MHKVWLVSCEEKPIAQIEHGIKRFGRYIHLINLQKMRFSSSGSVFTASFKSSKNQIFFKKFHDHEKNFLVKFIQY